MMKTECTVMLDAFQATFSKRYSQETKDRVFERVQNVPSQFVQQITERIEGMDKHPDNVGNAILAAWRSLDGRAAAESEAKGCPQCDGDGWITGYRKDTKTGQVTPYMCACAFCQPGHKYAGTRHGMLALGYMICPANDRKVQNRWWAAYQTHVAAWAKARGTEAGNLVPGDILASFDRMSAAATEAAA